LYLADSKNIDNPSRSAYSQNKSSEPRIPKHNHKKEIRKACKKVVLVGLTYPRCVDNLGDSESSKQSLREILFLQQALTHLWKFEEKNVKLLSDDTKSKLTYPLKYFFK
jgi:hypothetical protein